MSMDGILRKITSLSHALVAERRAEGVLRRVREEVRQILKAGECVASYGPEGGSLNLPSPGLLGARIVGEKGETVGTILVTGKKGGGEFTAGDEAVLRQIAAIASLALQRVGAREEAEKRRKEGRRTEAELRKERSTLEAAMLATDVMLALFDTEFNFIAVNPAYAETARMRPEEMIGRNHFDLYPNEENEAIFARVKETGVSVFFKDKPFTYPDQPERGVTYWDWSLVPAKEGPSGVVSALVMSLRETTRYRRAEEVLRVREGEFRAFFENAAVGTAQMEPSGRFMRVNDRFCDITGYSRAELLEKGPFDLDHPDERERDRELFERFLGAPDQVYDVEKRYLRKDGKTIWVHVTVTLVRDAAGVPLHTVGIIEDVTSRKEAEEALRGALRDAEKANRAKSEFLANMSHELRTPMTVILGYMDLLRASEISPSQRSMADAVEGAARRLLGIIDELLDISRIEAGRLRIEEEIFDLRRCVGESAELFRERAREKGIRLVWDVSPDLPPLLWGDSGRIGQVLVNLLGNALKFTDDGEIALSATAEGGSLLLAVRDTGIGIPAGRISELFEPFTQLDSSRTRRYGGSGLGLAICRQIIALMEGSIGVQSEEREGSIFTVTLPLRPAVQRHLPDPSPFFSSP